MLLFPFVSTSVITIQKYSLLLHKCFIITITFSNSFTILDHTRVCADFVSRYKIPDGFIAFSCIHLYIYMTLLTYRQAQYLISFWDMIQVQDIVLTWRGTSNISPKASWSVKVRIRFFGRIPPKWNHSS